MSERMLVTQALDERDLLVKKIEDKIKKASFLDAIKPNEDKVFGLRVSREEFEKKSEASYNQIMDLIARYDKIDAAIVLSNATTKIQTSCGEFTVAAAISLKNRMAIKNIRAKQLDFERCLLEKLKTELDDKLVYIDGKNQKLQEMAEDMRLSILGKDTKIKDDKPLEVVEAYIRENTVELVDPLDVRNKMVSLLEKRATLLAELETQIKVSNATTFIEID